MQTKLNRWLIAVTLLSSLNSPLLMLQAQGTAFTFQGRLTEGGNPANAYR
jgi:hypothetical protein